MASNDLPIKFQEHLQLTDVGISESDISFTTCTLESDKYIWYVLLLCISAVPANIFVSVSEKPRQKEIRLLSSIFMTTMQWYASQ